MITPPDLDTAASARDYLRAAGLLPPPEAAP